MREAAGFLTALGGPRAPRPEALRWFGVVGAAMGAGLGALWWAAAQVWPGPVAAAVVVAADLAGTGMLHLDGLVDAADGLLPHLPAERRLEVMRDPHVGAFGVGAALAAVLVRFAALVALRPAPLLLAGLWCLSRASMAVTVARGSYARADGGIVTAFGGSGPEGTRRGAGVAWGLFGGTACAAAALAAAWSVPAGPAAVAVAGTAFAGVLLLGRRRVGGFTGDVLGAAGFLAESAGLLAAAARW